jgi:GNAT superfamily N-acetyltransferase
MIRPLEDADLPTALAIAQDGVGVGWAMREDLIPHLGRRVVVAEEVAGIVGVATAGLRPVEGFLERSTPAVRNALALAGVRAPQPLLLLDLAVVVPTARRRGHYRALLADRLAWGAHAGASQALAFGWTPPDGCHIAPAMTRAGFVARARIPRFFHEVSLENGARCPECGNPCTCAAVVFTRPIGP